MLYAMENGHGGIAHAVGARFEGINSGYLPLTLPSPPTTGSLHKVQLLQVVKMHSEYYFIVLLYFRPTCKYRLHVNVQPSAGDTSSVYTDYISI